MTIIELLKDFAFKLIALAIPLLARRWYSKNDLSQHIKIRVRDEGEGIVFCGGDLPEVRIWIRITNLSPIAVEFDRIFGFIIHGSKMAEFKDLHRRSVKAARETEFQIGAALSAEQLTFLRKNRKQKFETTLHVSGYIHSRLYTYEIPYREVRTNNVQFINCDPLPPAA